MTLEMVKKEVQPHVFTEQELRLIKILSWRRAGETVHENAFVTWLKTQLPKNHTVDGFGNLHLQMGRNPVTMFSCHTDTMHFKSGEQHQQVMYDPVKEELFVEKPADCLGADDGVGIWIMLNMIDAKIPGHYVFHRLEEKGGQGAQWIRQNKAPWLKKFVRAIAFDRRGMSDVITHQSSRTCSDAFAQALADQLNAQNTEFKYAPCRDGVFTDTKVYADSIPECTNISVGYHRQHTANETQHIGFANKLLEAILKVQWSALPTKRDPAKDNESAYKRSGQTWGDMKHLTPAASPLPKKAKSNMTLGELEVFAHRFPAALAAVAHSLGVQFSDLKAAIYDQLLDEDTVTKDDDWDFPRK